MGDGPAVLLVTGRRSLIDAVTPVAAAVNVHVVVRADVESAGALWLGADLVLLGDDVAPRGVPGRRPDVVLVALSGAPDRTWKVAMECGAEQVTVLPEDQERLLGHLARLADPADHGGLVIGVLGGRGGAGASTLAACLAVTAAEDRPALLVDADPLGGGVEAIVGSRDAPGLRWTDLAGLRGPVRGTTLRQALPESRGASVLSWGHEPVGELSAEAVESVIDAGRRAFALVVVDLPRALSPPAMAALSRLDVALVVVPREVRAVLSAARVVEAVRPLVADVRLIVRGPAPGGLQGEAVADALDVPLHCELRAEPRLAETLERGDLPSPRGPLRRFCRDLVRLLPGAQPAAAGAGAP